ncbi:MAG: hypothetical protein ABFR89_12245 [Actinomycetota bacterium]
MTRAVAALLIAVTVLASCSPGGTRANPHRPVTLPVWYQEQYEFSSEFQQNQVLDGKLDFAEYETAQYAYSQCLVDHGAEVAEPLTYNDVEQDWEGAWFDPTGNFEQFETECYDENLSLLQQWWGWQQGGSLSEADIREEDRKAREVIVQCLQEHGLALELNPPTVEPLELTYYSENHPDTYNPCWNRANRP